MKNIISIFCILGAIAGGITACSDSGSSATEVTTSTEEEACANGTSTRKDEWCCSNFGYRCTSKSSSSLSNHSPSSNSSSSYASESDFSYNYTTKAKTMNLSLLYYKQLKPMDEINTNDGDPEISFTIKIVDTDGNETSQKTGTMLALKNQGTWSGNNTTTIRIPANTESIKVCPQLVEIDVMFDDKEYASNACYQKINIGKLANYEVVEQSDDKATYYELEWEWFLY